MPKYTCERCNKVFAQKSHYDNHLKRKKPCLLTSPSAPDNSKFTPITEQSDDDNDLKCEYCGMEFTRKGNKMRHINGRCKKINGKDDAMEKLTEKLIAMDARMKKLEEENKKLKVSEMKGITINTININSYGGILPFGKEIRNGISDLEYKGIFNRGFRSVPALVEKIHFDKNKPQNHNVYMSNVHEKYVVVYDGNDWILKNRDEFLQDMIDNNSMFLEDKFEELLDKLGDCEINKFKKFLDEIDDDKTTNKIKEELKMLFYNNRRMVRETKKLLKPDNVKQITQTDE